jgi:hypothetical protein
MCGQKFKKSFDRSRKYEHDARIVRAERAGDSCLSVVAF